MKKCVKLQCTYETNLRFYIWAGRAGQDGHGELHRQAGGGEGRPGEGGERPEDHLPDGGEAGPGAEAGRGEEARRGDQLPQADQPAAQGPAGGDHCPEEVDTSRNCLLVK